MLCSVVTLISTGALQRAPVLHNQHGASVTMCHSTTRRMAVTGAAAAAFGLVAMPALADEEYVSPAKAKILAAKAEACAKSPASAGCGAPKEKAVVKPTEGRNGRAERAQAASKKLAKQVEREKAADREAQKKRRELDNRALKEAFEDVSSGAALKNAVGGAVGGVSDAVGSVSLPSLPF